MAPEIVKSGKLTSVFKERETFMLQGKPCTIFDQQLSPPWAPSIIVDIPLLNNIITYPFIIKCCIDTPSKLCKSFIDYIASGEDEESSDEDEAIGNNYTVANTEMSSYDQEEADMDENDTDLDDDDNDDDDDDDDDDGSAAAAADS
jgi:hypothetical protein